MKTYYLFGLPFITCEVNSQEIDFLIDTGFDGSVLLPEEIVQNMNLERRGRVIYTLADGTSAHAQVFSVDIIWLGRKRIISIIAGPSDFALVGMQLLSQVKTTLNPSRHILTIENPD